ncbi:MAG: hypothetical protein RL708_1122 [Bacteroidota bacterium]|jgi:hypothetical protein
MENKYIHTTPENNIAAESVASYQMQDADDNHQLEEALKRTDMEKFQYLMKLVKTQHMMQKMSISHKP